MERGSPFLRWPGAATDRISPAMAATANLPAMLFTVAWRGTAPGSCSGISPPGAPPWCRAAWVVERTIGCVTSVGSVHRTCTHDEPRIASLPNFLNRAGSARPRPRAPAPPRAAPSRPASAPVPASRPSSASVPPPRPALLLLLEAAASYNIYIAAAAAASSGGERVRRSGRPPRGWSHTPMEA